MVDDDEDDEVFVREEKPNAPGVAVPSAKGWPNWSRRDQPGHTPHPFAISVSADTLDAGKLQLGAAGACNVSTGTTIHVEVSHIELHKNDGRT